MAAQRAYRHDVDVFADDDDVTMERALEPERTTARPVREAGPIGHKTTKMDKVDARLLAMARGEVEPEPAFDLLVIDDPFGGLLPLADPFGGLIPVTDDDEPYAEVLDDRWLVEDDAQAMFEPAPRAPQGIPRLRMTAAELRLLPLDPSGAFLLSHIDGLRTVEEVVDVSHLLPEDTQRVLNLLVALGAIRIV